MTAGLRRLWSLDAPALARTAHALGYVSPDAVGEAHAASLSSARQGVQALSTTPSAAFAAGCAALARARTVAKANAAFGTFADSSLTQGAVGSVATKLSWESLHEYAERGAASQLGADYAAQATRRW